MTYAGPPASALPPDDELLPRRPHVVARCKWTNCSTTAVGGAFSERDEEWVLPLCRTHLFNLSYSLWKRKSA